jgi:hypothetical protein
MGQLCPTTSFRINQYFVERFSNYLKVRLKVIILDVLMSEENLQGTEADL